MNNSRNIISKFDGVSNDIIREEVYNSAYPYCVMSLNIHSCLNIGNMMRSANLCGCKKFIIFGRRHYDKRSCVGVQNYIMNERVNGICDDKIDKLKIVLETEDYILDENIFYNYIINNNYLPIFVEQDSSSIIANNYNINNIINTSLSLNLIPLFIFGNENKGIPKNILDTHSKFKKYFIIELQQMGAMQSFNVSNCCSIICYKLMEIFNKNIKNQN
jgi:tRNA G18 (ribose-2'-O)-methylase SpoU